MKKNLYTLILICFIGSAFTGQAQIKKEKFEISFGLNAIDVYLDSGFGLNAMAEESLFSDYFTTNDWNVNSKARDTYSDSGIKMNDLPPISIGVAYYIDSKWALGVHFSTNYLDIIDLCYNAVGLPNMNFTNSEGFLKYNPFKKSKIEPFSQLTLGQARLGDFNSFNLGMDLGLGLWFSKNAGLSMTTGYRSYLNSYFSPTFQHTMRLTIRL